MSHRKTTLALLLSCGLASLATQAGQIQRTLLISVEGLHALDFSNYVKSHPSSALAALASQGVTLSPDDRAAQHDG